MTMTINGSSGLIFPDGSGQESGIGRNRIINGDMRIAQRTTSAITLTGSSGFPVDRMVAFYTSPGGAATAQQSSVAPAGFTNSMVYSVITGASITTGDYNCIQQNIEGYNVADLDYGLSTAKTVTLSFWVRSSLTGTFSGALNNSAQNRSYVYTYTISAANTWEYKTITIAGDTTGTWLKTNGSGVAVYWNMGFQSGSLTSTTNTWLVGAFTGVTGGVTPSTTTGATFYITGVQLEQNTSATPFERRMFSTEMALCQRYYVQSYPYGTVLGTNIGSSGAGMLGGVNYGATSFGYTMMGPFSFPVTMRTNASVTIYNSVTGSTTAASCIRNLNASTNVAGFVLSASDKQAYISCDNAPVASRAECAITASAEL